jgi:TrbL/VirB6 plasmid conjugal transfer protein
VRLRGSPRAGSQRHLRKLLLIAPLLAVFCFLGGAVAIAAPVPGTPAPLPSSTAVPVQPTVPPTASCDFRQTPQQSGTGVNSLMALPCLRGSNGQTLFELYPASAYTIHVSSDPNANIPNDIANALAQWSFSAVTWLGTICAAMIEWTFSLQLSGPSSNAINTDGILSVFLTSLAKTIYQPFLLSAIIIAGAWITWHGLLRRRMTVTLESLGWILLSSTVAAVFLAAPTTGVGSLEKLSLTGSQIILNTVSQADTDVSNPDNHNIFGSDSSVQQYSGLRAAVNRYWQIYVYEPWQVAEFGSLEAANAKTSTSATLSQIDLQAHTSGTAADQDNANNTIENQLGSLNSQANKNWYDGAQGSQRFMLGVIALLVISIATGLLIAVAGTILLSQIALVVLTMVAPLFFLVGIHPSVGRRIFLRWGELMLSFAFRRVLYSAFLAVVLVLGGIIMSNVASRSWFLAAMLQLILVIAAFIYRKPLAAVFSQVGAGRLEPIIGPGRDSAIGWASRNAAVQRARQFLSGQREGWRSRPAEVKFNEAMVGGARQDKADRAGRGWPRAGTLAAGTAQTAAAVETGGISTLAAGGLALGGKLAGAGRRGSLKVEQEANKTLRPFISSDPPRSAWPTSNRGGSLPQEDVDERAEQRRHLLRSLEAQAASNRRLVTPAQGTAAMAPPKVETKPERPPDGAPPRDATLRERGTTLRSPLPAPPRRPPDEA